MKISYKFFIVFTFLFTFSISYACDFCGCATNGGSLGMLNYNTNSFLGSRYIHQSYRTNDGLYSNSAWRNEAYNTLHILGKLNLGKNFFVSAVVPFHFHDRETTAQSIHLSGLGDVSVLGGYKFLDTNFHELQFSGGIKLPTGKYDENANGSINPGFQLGTGSFDYLANIDYRFKFKNWVWINNLNYNIKTTNDEEYRFGNQLNVASAIGYAFKSNTFQLLPSTGIASEIYEANEFFGNKVLHTSGDITLLKIATDVSFKKMSFGFQFQSPLNQNLNGGLVKSQYRSSVYLNYNF